MFEKIERDAISVTYEWYCPGCHAWNRYRAFKDIDSVRCHGCGLFLVQRRGRWERRMTANCPAIGEG